MAEWVIGIDEAGRGPLAGPVSVGAVLIRRRDYKIFKGVRDSKKLSEKQREEWFSKIKKAHKEGTIFYAVALSHAESIDKNGIVKSIEGCLRRAIGKLPASPKKVEVLLDGGLHAPKEFKNQKTIIGGDNKEMAISMASIVAKVSRDRSLLRVSKDFPEYKFEIHKGYGTKEHRKKIIFYGPSIIHRKTYLKNLPIKLSVL